MTIIKSNIEVVAELMKVSTAKAEKYTKEVWKDLEEDTGAEVSFNDVLEVIKMEHNCKVNNIKNVGSSTQEKQKKEKKLRTSKVSEEKTQLFNQIYENLYKIYGDSVKIIKKNKLILVKINENKEIKIDLVESRAKKD